MVDINEKLLISKVHLHPCLYDKNDEAYNSKLDKSESWSEISSEMGISVERCKTRWRVLRDRYVREYCAAKKQSGNATKSKQTLGKLRWKHMKEMAFLNAHIAPGLSLSRRLAWAAQEDAEDDADTQSDSLALSEPLVAYDETKDHIERVLTPTTNSNFVEDMSPLPDGLDRDSVDIEQMQLNSIKDLPPSSPTDNMSEDIFIDNTMEHELIDEDSLPPSEISDSLSKPKRRKTDVNDADNCFKELLCTVNELLMTQTHSNDANDAKSPNETFYKVLDGYMLQLPVEDQDDLKIEILNLVNRRRQTFK